MQAVFRTVSRNSALIRSSPYFERLVCLDIADHSGSGACNFSTEGPSIPTTNVEVTTKPPHKESDYAFSGGPINEDQDEKGKRPSFDAAPSGPDASRLGGAATIPSTNIALETEAGESQSRKTMEPSPSGNAMAMEEHDGNQQ